MQVKFTTNLGSNDAAALHLDHTKCKEGSLCELSDATAKALTARGLAVAIPSPPKKAVEVPPVVAPPAPAPVVPAPVEKPVISAAPLANFKTKPNKR